MVSSGERVGLNIAHWDAMSHLNLTYRTARDIGHFVRIRPAGNINDQNLILFRNMTEP